MPASSFGAQKFGLIFDITGDATIKSSTGKLTPLKKSLHILRSVSVGDTVQVNGAGKVLIVSLKDQKGYEVLSDTTARVERTKLAKLSGTVNVKEGYSVPTKNARGLPRVTGLINSTKEPCIKTLSPLNTMVPSVTPKLIWENLCEGAREVSVKVIKVRSVIYESQTDESSAVIPAGILDEGQTYRWFVDGGQSNGIMGGTFSTLDKETADLIQTKKAALDRDSGFPERLNYLFLLMDKNLSELAEAEIAELKSDFPDNTYIQELK